MTKMNVTRTCLPPLAEYAAELESAWQSTWITNGGQVLQRLESALREHLEFQGLHSICNGTVALQIAIKALGLTGEVITTPFSYVATSSSLFWEGCTPIFADIDPQTLNIDPAAVERAITPKTTGILATHVYGNPCDVVALAEIARKHRLLILYDAAHAFGVRFNGGSVLNWGDASILSFHATKVFHSCEGGAIASSDSDVCKRVTSMRNFGHNGEESFDGVGINGKMSELHAAMGLCVLRRMSAITEGRRAATELYDQLLAHSRPELKRPLWHSQSTRNYAYYPIIYPCEADLLRDRDRLRSHDVFPRRYFYPPLSRLPYARTSDVPVAEDVSRRVLCLPLHAELSESDVARVCHLLSGH